MEPTKEQTAIVESNEKSIIVMSVAGSGKTTTIVMCVKKDLEEGVDKTKILLTTFSKKMARELQDKIPELEWVGTIHSVCKKIVDNYGYLVGYDETTLVEEEKYLIKKAKEASHIKGTIKSLKEKLMKYFETEEVDGSYGFDVFLKLYLQYMKDHQVMTFDLVEYYATRILEIGVPLHFERVYIDEFQDTSGLEMRLIKALSYDTIKVVGDVMQNLYEFRGTTIDNIMKFPGKRFPLSISFRCREPVVQMANRLISLNEFNYELKMEAVKNGVPIKIEEEIDNLSSIIQSYLREGFRPEEIMILCATNKQTAKITEMLESFITIRNPNYYLRGKAYELASAFVGMARNFYRNYMTTRFAIEAKYLDQKEINYLERQMSTGDMIRDMLGKGFEKYVRLASRDILLSQKIEILFEMEGYDNCFGFMEEESEKAKQIVIMLQKLEQEDKEGYLLFEEKDVPEVSNSAIQVMTMHGSKGKEAPVVILPWWEDGNFPSLSKPMADLRLAYVAVTRAKEKLCIIKTGSCRYVEN